MSLLVIFFHIVIFKSVFCYYKKYQYFKLLFLIKEGTYDMSPFFHLLGLNRTDDWATFIVEAENKKKALKVMCSLALDPNSILITWIQRYILELEQ